MAIDRAKKQRNYSGHIKRTGKADVVEYREIAY